MCGFFLCVVLHDIIYLYPMFCFLSITHKTLCYWLLCSELFMILGLFLYFKLIVHIPLCDIYPILGFFVLKIESYLWVSIFLNMHHNVIQKLSSFMSWYARTCMLVWYIVVGRWRTFLMIACSCVVRWVSPNFTG